jgi:hypothetical protein
MGKKSFLTIFLLWMAAGALVYADEVISIDINNYGNDIAFTGEAAVPGATQWIAFYEGWGVPMGSPRSANLRNAVTLPEIPEDIVAMTLDSTYAAQVWIGDDGQSHGYVGSGENTLLGDGFVNEGVPVGDDPNYARLAFFGGDLFGEVANEIHAYMGTFNMYVYGNTAGDFILSENGGARTTVKSVTGTTAGFVEGENYVVFPDVSIADPNSVRLYYTGQINGIQLVSKRTPKAIVRSDRTTDPNDYTINAADWDVAYDTNNRSDEEDYGVGSYYGPDNNADMVYVLDNGDYMEYDIFVAADDKGRYDLTVTMDTTYGATEIVLSLDGQTVGVLEGKANGPETVGPLPIVLFEGPHTLRWQSTGYYGGNIDDLIFTYVGPPDPEDCAAVYRYGANLAGDANGDCRVDFEDLNLILLEWARSYTL